MTPDSWSQFSIALLIVTACVYIIRKVMGAAAEAFGHRFGDQAAAEVLKRAPALARWIIERGIRRLPGEHQDRYRQEWLAELQANPKF
jgi:hypothetical protein